MSDAPLISSSSHSSHSSHSADEPNHDRLIAAAKAEAQRLRRQAIGQFGGGVFEGMGDVWRNGNALWERTRHDSQRAISRSAQRLQARWQAHQKHRNSAL